MKGVVRQRSFLELALMGDLRTTAEIVTSRLDTGESPTALVRNVLVPVQQQVGQQWQDNLISVADEHTATATVDNALSVLAYAVGLDSPGTRGRLAVVCAEGDWHTLPARMAAQVCQWLGWEVTFLGGSLPSEDLSRWLDASRPDGLVVTAALSRFIPGAARVCAAAEQVGVPAVVGGRGFGADAVAAEALGLRWAAVEEDLEDVLAGPCPDIDLALTADREAEAHLLRVSAQTIAVEVAGTLTATHRNSSSQQASTARDFENIMNVVSVSVLTGDARVYASYVQWLAAVLRARGVPEQVLPRNLEQLVPLLPPEAVAARALFAGGTPDVSPPSPRSGL